jgi:DNA-binding transcriptional ArsR family regulator
MTDMNANKLRLGPSLLDQMAAEASPRDMRNLATSLLQLADSLDQDWQGPPVRSIFRWPNAKTRIERNAVNLAMRAKVIYEYRRRRRGILPPELLGEPAWDMMLDLFMQYAGGAKVSVSSLCIASDAPPSTALRHIGLLEEGGLVIRSPSSSDKRMTFVELTDKAIVTMGSYLESHE